MKRVLNKIFSDPDIKLIFSLFSDYCNKLFIVGGAVRDSLMNGFDHNYDIDFAINAPIEVVYEYLLQQQLNFQNIQFNNSLLNYGVIRIVIDNKKYDVTMFRSEKYINKSRYPIVNYTEDINIDCIRRDFTVNSLYLGHDKILYDPTGFGISDLQRKKIRFVINDLNISKEIVRKITEDPLRIIRYIRMYLKFFPDQKMNNKLKIMSDHDIISFCNTYLNKIISYDTETISILLHNLDLLKVIGVSKAISELNKMISCI